MSKKTISELELMQLQGLLLLAKDFNARLAEIHNATMKLLDEEDEIGHCSDAVYSDYSAESLLKNLHITVES